MADTSRPSLVQRERSRKQVRLSDAHSQAHAIDDGRAFASNRFVSVGLGAYLGSAGSCVPWSSGRSGRAAASQQDREAEM